MNTSKTIHDSSVIEKLSVRNLKEESMNSGRGAGNLRGGCTSPNMTFWVGLSMSSAAGRC